MQTLEIEPDHPSTAGAPSAQDLLTPLLLASTMDHAKRDAATSIPGVLVGELLAIVDDGCSPLVRYSGSDIERTIRARSIVDLNGPHIGAQVLLIFEGGKAELPIVIGVLRQPRSWPEATAPSAVQVDADGERLVVSAADQLVLRCGKSSITLTKAGKVLIEGSYLLSRSTGVNRIKGGSVQLN